MLRLGVVGCGKVTTMFHLKAIRELADANLIAVVDRHASRMERVRGTCGASRGYLDYGELLSDPEVDVVVINTPPGLHEEMVIQALKAGKHVLCEKPLATSVDGALRIKRAQEGTGLVVLPVHNYAFTPILDDVNGLLASGDVGRVEGVSVSFDNNLKWYNSKTDFRLENEFSIVEDIMPHILSVTRSLAGAATTVGDVKAWRKSLRVIDNVSLTLGTDRGIPVDCTMSWTKLIPSFRVGAHCTSGRILMDLIRSPFSATVDSNGVRRMIGEKRGLGLYLDLLRYKHPSFPRQYEHLCRLVEGSEKPRITLEDEIAMIGMIGEVVKRISKTDKSGTR